MDNLDWSFTTTVWDIGKDFATFKKSLHSLATGFLNTASENGFTEKGVAITISELDGGELEAYVFGVNIMKNYTKWLVKMFLVDEPSITLKLNDPKEIYHYKIWNTDTGVVLLEGFAEDIIDDAIKNETDWHEMMTKEIDEGVRRHDFEIYSVQFNTDMSDLESGITTERTHYGQ